MAIGLSLWTPHGSGDTTPGGASSALVLEDADGALLEDGTFILLEG